MNRMTEQALPPPVNIQVLCRIGASQQQSLTTSRDLTEPPSRRETRSVMNVNLRVPDGTELVSSANTCPTFSPVAADHTRLDSGPVPAIPVFWSHQLVKTAVSFYWNISTFRAMIRAGPLIEMQSRHSRKTQPKRYRQIGLGLLLSIYFPKCLRSSLGLTLFTFQMMMTTRTNTALQWSLAFPKTTSPDAEIFRSVRAITHYLAWSSGSTPEIFQRGHSYVDAELSSADNLGRICLHLAASRGNLGVLSYLIRQVSLENIEKKDIQGRTPLHYAPESSRAPGIIDMLRGKGCNVSAVDDVGRTALHWAARRGNFEAVKNLIAIGGRETLLTADMNGRRPLQEACRGTAPALHRYLEDLEPLKGLNFEQSDTIRLQRGRVNRNVSSVFSIILEILGISSMIFLLILGNPD